MRRDRRLAQPIRWDSVPAFLAYVTRGRRMLVLTVMAKAGRWASLAVEGPKRGGLDFLDDHAHDSIGLFDGAAEAFVAAEHYARAWRAGNTKALARIKACSCGPIEAAPTVN